ncbi:MAG TPA: choice-of-anchor B family protein, partial [Gemmatimonadales bacterium]|nr:choice-of-anchor B family protein [Gemmatimonadales bacterium]
VAMSGNELYAARTGTVSILPAPPVHPGTVLVFRRDSDGRWTESGKVSATDVGLADEFGAALAVSGDWMAVGAPKQGVGGAVYVFQKRAGTWTQVAKLSPPQPAPGDAFGTAVAIDGQRLVIGAPGSDSTRGAAFASRRDARSGGWSPVARIGTGTEVSDRLGEAVSLSGARAVVGAPGLLRGGNNPFAPPGSQRVKAGTVLVFHAGSGNTWTQEAALAVGGTDTTRSFGAAVLLDGDEAFVGAPRSSKAAGVVYAFRRAGATWQQVARLQPAAAEPLTGFGSALARSGSHLLVGAPITAKNAGGVYVFAKGADGWTEAQHLAFAGTGNHMVGSRLAAHGDHAVATAPLADNGMGALIPYVRTGATGTWTEGGKVVDSPVEMAKVTGSEVKCAGGKAGSFDCQQVDLLSYLPLSAIGARRGINVNDIWGWTDPQTNREYALLGRMDGTSFVDVTDPANPRYLGDLPMHQGANPNFWRDIKVYKDHAFIVADGSGPHGMQVFDLTQLRDVQGAPVTFAETAHYDRIASAHNIAINEETGYAYPIGANGGGETCGGALHMIDIRDPRAPKFAGCFADPTTGNQRTGYTHDTQCVTYKGPDTRYTGREICFNSSETAVGIADVTDKASPKALSTASYPNVAYTHQGWLSEDHKYFYVDDEGDEISGNVPNTRTLVWDVTKLDEPVLVKEFLGTTSASDHNLYVKGKYVYQSNYLAGLRILDISDPANPRETGFFDTVPAGENKPGFAGSWSNYPYFRSGTIVVSSIGEGLFVLRHRPEEPAVP